MFFAPDTVFFSLLAFWAHPQIPKPDLVVVAACRNLIDILQINQTQDYISDKPRRPLTNEVYVFSALPLFLVGLILLLFLLLKYLSLSTISREQHI